MLRSIYGMVLLAAITIALTIMVVITGVVTRSHRRAYHYVRLWAKSLISVFRVQITVRGTENTDFSQPMLYMSNHVSQADIPILMTATPAGLAFVAKNSLAHIPFLSWSMRMVGMVFISREATRGAIDTLNSAAINTPPGMNLIIFPEGTRSKTGSGVLNPIKKGGFHMALACGRSIQPVVIYNSENVLPRGGMAIRPGWVEVRYGKPIPVTAESTVEQLMAAYRVEMEGLLEQELLPHACEEAVTA